VYLRYGTCLLEHAMQSSDVFGSAVVRAAERKQQEEQAEQEDMELGEDNSAQEEDNDDEVLEEDEDGQMLPQDAENKMFPEEDEEEEEDGDEQEGDVMEEDADDLQIAWELLDTARLIYSAMGEEALEDLALCFEKLADHSMEMDNFARAEEDYRKALDLLKKVCAPHDRRLANLYEFLGGFFLIL